MTIELKPKKLLGFTILFLHLLFWITGFLVPPHETVYPDTTAGTILFVIGITIWFLSGVAGAVLICESED